MIHEILAPGIEIYCGDCLAVMPTLGKVDAVVTDPPYGLALSGGTWGNRFKGEYEQWDGKAADLSLLPENVPTIIWGGNHFALPPARCFLIWDKGPQFYGRTFADVDYAWTNLDAAARIFKDANRYEEKKHPTQKPSLLMEFCIRHLPDNAQKILDPFMGSGTTGVAAVKLGRKFIGIEISETYYEIAKQRIIQAIEEKSMDMFNGELAEITQPELGEQL